MVEEVGADVQRFRPGDFVVVPFCHCDNTCPVCRKGHAGGLPEPRLHRRAARGSTPGSPRPTAAWSRPPGCPTPSQVPALLTLVRRDGDRLARRGLRRRQRRATPWSSSATAPSGCAACSPRARWAPSGSSRCRATSPARRSPAVRRHPHRRRARQGGRGARSSSSPTASAPTRCSSASAPTTSMRTRSPLRPARRDGRLRRRAARRRAAGQRDVRPQRRGRRRDGTGAQVPPRAARPHALRRDRPRPGLRPDAAAGRGRRGLPRDGRAARPIKVLLEP